MAPRVDSVERVGEQEVFTVQIRQAELVGQLTHKLQELRALMKQQRERLEHLQSQRQTMTDADSRFDV
jgi:hypothetical protein